MEMFLNADTAIIFITAVIFTLVGYMWGMKHNIAMTVGSTIDSLIADGYLKTRGLGKDMEILKWREWNDKTD